MLLLITWQYTAKAYKSLALALSLRAQTWRSEFMAQDKQPQQLLAPNSRRLELLELLLHFSYTSTCGSWHEIGALHRKDTAVFVGGLVPPAAAIQQALRRQHIMV
jgi:hypothetical protein